MPETVLKVQIELLAGEHWKYSLVGRDGPIPEKWLPLSSPANYGIVLQKNGPDGEWMDAVVYSSTSLQVGEVVDAIPQAILLREENDHKVICVTPGHALPSDYREQLEQFFSALGGHVSWGTIQDLQQALSNIEVSPGRKKAFFEQLGVCHYRLDRCDVQLFMNTHLAEHFEYWDSLDRLVQLAQQPFVIPPVMAFPDLDQEKPIPSGVALVTHKPYILPFALGNSACGFRLLVTDIAPQELTPQTLKTLAEDLEDRLSYESSARRALIAGVNIREILSEGARGLARHGMIEESSLERIEYGGRCGFADADTLPPHLVRWAKNILGSMGWWGHCLELSVIEKNTPVGKALGLEIDRVSAVIHIGGRFLWPFLLKALIKEIVDEAMLEEVNRRQLISRGLFAVSTERPAGKKLFGSYGATLNFAFANRAVMQLLVQQGLSRVLHRQVECTLISDNSHIGLDETVIDGQTGWLHRTAQHRIYPPGDPSLSGIFERTGFPVVILGAPGVSSLVVTAGKDPASTHNLCSHGVAMGISVLQQEKQNPFRSSRPDLLPFHNTAYRVDEVLAAQNLQHTLETFTQLKVVQQAAVLRPVMNFRAAPKNEFNDAWLSKEF